LGHDLRIWLVNLENWRDGFEISQPVLGIEHTYLVFSNLSKELEHTQKELEHLSKELEHS
jgi:hypothetical protein